MSVFTKRSISQLFGVLLNRPLLSVTPEVEKDTELNKSAFFFLS